MLNDLEIRASEIVLNEMPDLYAFIEHMEGCSPQNHEAFLKTCQELQNQEYSHRNVCIQDLLQEPAVFKIISRNIDRLDLKYALLKDQWDSTLNKQIYDTEKRVAKEILEKITFKLHLLSLNANAKPSDQLLEYLFNKTDFVADIKTALVSLKQNQVDFDEGIVLCCQFTGKSFAVYWEEFLNKLECFPQKGFKRLIGLVCSIGALKKKLLSDLDWLILKEILNGQSAPDIQEKVHKMNGIKSYSIQTTPLIRSLEILQLCSEEKVGRRKVYTFSGQFKEFMNFV